MKCNGQKFIVLSFFGTFFQPLETSPSIFFEFQVSPFKFQNQSQPGRLSGSFVFFRRAVFLSAEALAEEDFLAAFSTGFLRAGFFIASAVADSPIAFS